VKTSCGWPCRYVLICSWNVLWSTVLTLSFVPVFWVNALKTAAYADFGTGSDAFEPTDELVEPRGRHRAASSRGGEAVGGGEPSCARRGEQPAPCHLPSRELFRLEHQRGFVRHESLLGLGHRSQNSTRSNTNEMLRNTGTYAPRMSRPGPNPGGGGRCG
jgi:hypothetical protein